MSADDNYFRQETRARRKIEKEWNVSCSHKQNIMSYLERHKWAIKKMKQGHQQKQCPECKKWFFECEM